MSFVNSIFFGENMDNQKGPLATLTDLLVSITDEEVTRTVPGGEAHTDCITWLGSVGMEFKPYLLFRENVIAAMTEVVNTNVNVRDLIFTITARLAVESKDAGLDIQDIAEKFVLSYSICYSSETVESQSVLNQHLISGLSFNVESTVDFIKGNLWFFTIVLLITSFTKTTIFSNVIKAATQTKLGKPAKQT